MKNYVLTFVLAVLVVLVGTTLRHAVAGTNSPAVSSNQVLAYGGGPVPPSVSYGGGPVPPAISYGGGPVPPSVSYGGGPVPPAVSYGGGPVPPSTAKAAR